MICTYQTNDLERNHSVNLMSQIYSYAPEVILWLGPEADRNNQALRSIERYQDVERLRL
jgi:hypothetical protein